MDGRREATADGALAVESANLGDAAMGLRKQRRDNTFAKIGSYLAGAVDRATGSAAHHRNDEHLEHCESRSLCAASAFET